MYGYTLYYLYFGISSNSVKVFQKKIFLYMWIYSIGGYDIKSI